MSPHKTELSRLALQSHSGPLSMRERRALILCDGHRNLHDLSALLGPEAPAMIMRLYEAGYLTNEAPREVAASAPIAAIQPLAPPARAPSAPTRRSLVAAKLYMLGMLELQRNESAIAHRVRLQASQDPEAVLAHLLAALHCLQRNTNTSMAQRVRERLTEVLPEDYLPALETPNAPTPELAAR
jgi:hypothetical protein